MKKLALIAGALAALALAYALWPAPEAPTRVALVDPQAPSTPERSGAQLPSQPELPSEPESAAREEAAADPTKLMSTDADRPPLAVSAHVARPRRAV